VTHTCGYETKVRYTHQPEASLLSKTGFPPVFTTTQHPVLPGQILGMLRRKKRNSFFHLTYRKTCVYTLTRKEVSHIKSLKLSRCNSKGTKKISSQFHFNHNKTLAIVYLYLKNLFANLPPNKMNSINRNNLNSNIYNSIKNNNNNVNRNN